VRIPIDRCRFGSAIGICDIVALEIYVATYWALQMTEMNKIIIQERSDPYPRLVVSALQVPGIVRLEN
jgi:uncharacterized membrane protein YwzB